MNPKSIARKDQIVHRVLGVHPLAPVVPDDCARDTTSRDQITLPNPPNHWPTTGPHPGTSDNWIFRGGSRVCVQGLGFPDGSFWVRNRKLVSKCEYSSLEKANWVEGYVSVAPMHHGSPPFHHGIVHLRIFLYFTAYNRSCPISILFSNLWAH